MTTWASSLRAVEVEVGSRCNRRCEYCPVSTTPNPAVPHLMGHGVFTRLMHELRAISYNGRLSYHFYNEPLLRKDLEQLVALAADHVPAAFQVLFTNGNLLTDGRRRNLREAGIDLFVVTAHGGALPFTQGEVDTVVQSKSELVLTNRGGNVTVGPAVDVSTVSSRCFAPSEMLIVTVSGDVLLCYEDFGRTLSFGNIMERPLREIWSSPNFVITRELLTCGLRSEASALCSKCNNVAHTRPGRSDRSEPFWNDMPKSKRP